MRWQIHRRISPIAVAIMALLAVIVHLMLHVPLWLALVFTMLGIVINAIVASARRDAP